MHPVFSLMKQRPSRAIDAEQGKVRDTYDLGDKLLIVTTDRLSAFDRVLAAIPFKVRSGPGCLPSPAGLQPAIAFAFHSSVNMLLTWGWAITSLDTEPNQTRQVWLMQHAIWRMQNLPRQKC